MATARRKRGPQISLSPEELASRVIASISASSSDIVDPQSSLPISDVLIKQIEHYARHCFAFYACWMPADLAPFSQLTNTFGFDIYDIQRFESNETKQIGLTLDLQACIPSLLYPLLARTKAGTTGALLAQRVC